MHFSSQRCLGFFVAVVVTQTSQEHSMSKRCIKGTDADLPLGIRLCHDFTFEATAIKGHRCGHAGLWLIPVLAEAPLGGWIRLVGQLD